MGRVVIVALAEYRVNRESQVIAVRAASQASLARVDTSRGRVVHLEQVGRLASLDFLVSLERQRHQVQVDSPGPVEHQEQQGLREHLGRPARAGPVARRGRVVLLEPVEPRAQRVLVAHQEPAVRCQF